MPASGMIGLAVGAMLAGTAVAKDTAPCAAGMICASRPESVVAALQKEGYNAKLETDTEGDPSIASSAAGYQFDVLFYGCEKHAQCDSLQFRLTFKADPTNTIALANRWNTTNGLLQASVKADTRMIFNHDLTTVGGVNANNFADLLARWTADVGEVSKFFAADTAASKPIVP